MTSEKIDLNFLARQLERVLSEQAKIGMSADVEMDRACLRDTMEVITAMVHRVETSNDMIITELRAIQRMLGRMNDRIGRLEDAEASKP